MQTLLCFFLLPGEVNICRLVISTRRHLASLQSSTQSPPLQMQESFSACKSPLHTQSISHATSILRMHIDSLLNAIKDIYIYNQAPRALAGCNRGKAIYIPKSWCWRGNPRSNLNPTWYIPLAKQYNPRRTPLVYACLCQRHGHIFNQACGGGVLTPYELWRHSARMTPLTGHHL